MRVFGRVAGVLATSVVLASAFVGAGEASPTAADPYSSRINTQTTVRTPTPIHTDTKVGISVKVTANSPDAPTGTVTLTLHSSTGGAGQSVAAAADLDGWTRTIDYDGGTERLQGPAFPDTGDWMITAVFHPADNTFRGSRDGWIFEVIDGGGDNPGDNGEDNDGLLPDTGGPALLWLLLGLGLVGGGAGAVVVARRRRETAHPAI
jgi:LPXTG-motif cell wall-anchored protein